MISLLCKAGKHMCTYSHVGVKQGFLSWLLHERWKCSSAPARKGLKTLLTFWPYYTGLFQGEEGIWSIQLVAEDRCSYQNNMSLTSYHLISLYMVVQKKTSAFWPKRWHGFQPVSSWYRRTLYRCCPSSPLMYEHNNSHVASARYLP